jgi:hypothetical protein
MHSDRARHRWGAWLDSLAERVRINKLTVALALERVACDYAFANLATAD